MAIEPSTLLQHDNWRDALAWAVLHLRLSDTQCTTVPLGIGQRVSAVRLGAEGQLDFDVQYVPPGRTSAPTIEVTRGDDVQGLACGRATAADLRDTLAATLRSAWGDPP